MDIKNLFKQMAPFVFQAMTAVVQGVFAMDERQYGKRAHRLKKLGEIEVDGAKKVVAEVVRGPTHFKAGEKVYTADNGLAVSRVEIEAAKIEAEKIVAEAQRILEEAKTEAQRILSEAAVVKPSTSRRR